MIRIPLIVVCLSLASCQPPKVSLQDSTHDVKPEAYKEAYRTWTRGKEPFSVKQMANVLHVSATYEIAAFRAAYVARYSKDYSLPEVDRRAMLDLELADAASVHRFLVSLAGADRNDSKLGSDKSAWKMWLLDDHGHQTAPSLIKSIHRPNAAIRRYFPSVTTQRVVYRVSFPTTNPDGTPTIDPASRRISLRFAGALGQVDLVWDVVSPER